MNIFSIETYLSPFSLLIGEHMLRFDFDLCEMSEEENKKLTPSLTFLGELPISEKWTVRQLKGWIIVTVHI